MKRMLICLGLFVVFVAGCQAAAKPAAAVPGRATPTPPSTPSPSATASKISAAAQTATDWAQFQVTMSALKNQMAQIGATSSAAQVNGLSEAHIAPPTPTPLAYNYNPLNRPAILPPKTSCAQPDPKVPLRIDLDNAGLSLLSFFNQGGTVERVQAYFQQEAQKIPQQVAGNIKTADITGDGVPEIIVWIAHQPNNELLGYWARDLNRFHFQDLVKTPVQQSSLTILTCNHGNYEILQTGLSPEPVGIVDMPAIADLNGDGIPELILANYVVLLNHSWVLEINPEGWDGSKLVNLLDHALPPDSGEYSILEARVYLGEKNQGSVVIEYGDYQLTDIDHNDTTEVIVSNHGFTLGANCNNMYRETEIVLMWDGHGLTSFYQRAPAKYMIQAIWDGDQASQIGRWDAALQYYQRAIKDKRLRTRIDGFYPLPVLCIFPQEPTPTPQPFDTEDKEERSRLEAYSLYKIMLVYAAEGKRDQALKVYNQLQLQFGKKESVTGFIEIANIFWDRYSSGEGLLSDACQAVRTFANLNEEKTYTYLNGIRYYSNKKYSPEDVCPY